MPDRDRSANFGPWPVTGGFSGGSMTSASMDINSILNRALDMAAQNLRVEKILLQLGLDPANVTFDAVFNRLVDVGFTISIWRTCWR